MGIFAGMSRRVCLQAKFIEPVPPGEVKVDETYLTLLLAETVRNQSNFDPEDCNIVRLSDLGPYQAVMVNISPCHAKQITPL